MSEGQLVKKGLHDFSGGLNLIAEATELESNESPDCMNVTLTERGAAVKRLGNEAETQEDLPNAVPVNLFWSNLAGRFYMQVGAELWQRDSAGAWTERTRAAAANAFTTSARATLADFTDGSADRIFMVHPVDGILSFPAGAGDVIVESAGATATGIAVWQNRLWILSASVPSQLAYSALGDGDGAYGTVLIRDKDISSLRAVISAPSGNLLVFKDHSSYRINDSNTGAYTTIDANHGASGPLAVNSLKGIVCTVNEEGVWVTDGNGPLQEASAKLRPLFGPGMLNLSLREGWTVGITNDTFLISISRMGSSVNDLTLEYDPINQWMVPHSYGAVAFARSEGAVEETFLAHTATVSSKAQIRKVGSGGDDGGTAIASHFRTAWLRPSRETLNSIRRIRITGRGAFDFYVSKDFQAGDGTLRPLDLSTDVTIYGGGIPGEYGPAGGHGFTDEYSWGYAKAISILVRESSDLSFNRPEILEAGQQEEGAWSLYGTRVDFIPLGDA